MPCVEESTPAEYLLHADSDNGNKKASLALNALANVGESINRYIFWEIAAVADVLNSHYR